MRNKAIRKIDCMPMRYLLQPVPVAEIGKGRKEVNDPSQADMFMDCPVEIRPAYPRRR